MSRCSCRPDRPPSCDDGKALLAAETRAVVQMLRMQGARPPEDPDRIYAEDQAEEAHRRLEAHRAGEGVMA